MNRTCQRLLAFLVAVGGLGTALLFCPTPAALGSAARAPLTARCVNPGGTGTCYASIQAAIDDSSYGDTINVLAGTYHEKIAAKNGVSIYGQGWDKTIITGDYLGVLPVVDFPSGIDATTVISGVQVTGGGDPYVLAAGGGMTIMGSPTIVNTWVFSNTRQYGGGVYIGGGSPTLINVPAWSNRALYGGGFYITNNAVVTLTSDSSLFDGTVWWNSARFEGGAFYVDHATATFSGLRVWWNTADDKGGGVYWQDSAGSLQQNVFFGNSVTNTNSLGGGAHVTGPSTVINIDGNWFEANSAVLVGGGLNLENVAMAVVNANTIVTNTAYGGAGVSIESAGLVTFTNNIVARNAALSTNPTALNIYNAAPRIINNTIADNPGPGPAVYMHTADGIVVVNNIISGNGTGLYRAEGTMTTDTVDYNDVHSNTVQNYYAVMPGSHDVSISPDFAGAGDMRAYYHLLATSPIYKAGSLSWAPAKDIDGDLRIICASMGADQLGCTRMYLPLIVK